MYTHRVSFSHSLVLTRHIIEYWGCIIAHWDRKIDTFYRGILERTPRSDGYEVAYEQNTPPISPRRPLTPQHDLADQRIEMDIYPYRHVCTNIMGELNDWHVRKWPPSNRWPDWSSQQAFGDLLKMYDDSICLFWGEGAKGWEGLHIAKKKN